MKKIIGLIFIGLFISACGADKKDSDAMKQAAINADEAANKAVEAAAQAAEAASAPSSFYNINGKELERPTNYRKWIYVGTPVTPDDMNNGQAPFPELHSVYIDPASYEHYKNTGQFRDGTIMVKELVSVGSKAAPSGAGYFMGDFIGLEATIKSKAAFPTSPGNWAYYSFTDYATGVLKDKTEPFPDAACNSCHEVSAADDFVFTQYYPVLSAAKAFGQGSPEDKAQRTAFPSHAPAPAAEPATETAAE